MFRPTHSPAPIRRRPTWTHRISLVVFLPLLLLSRPQAFILTTKHAKAEGDRDVSVLIVSWQLSNGSRSLDFKCAADVVGVVGKFARVLLGLISGATMKAVIYVSLALLARQ